MRHHFATLLATAMPAAIAGRIRADADLNPKKLFAELNTLVAGMDANQKAKFAELEKAINQQAVQIAAFGMNGGATGIVRPDDPTYSASFDTFFRTGRGEDDIRTANAAGQRATINAALSVGSNSDGGYLAPNEWDRRILQAQVATSPMRRLATVQPTGVGAFTTLWNTGEWGSGWVGETAARPLTTSAQLAPITFADGEIYANVAATQKLLDDSTIDTEAWLAGSVEGEFNRQEGISFIAGNGVNKPRGLLTFITGGASADAHPGGVLDVVPSGNASTVTADRLVTFTYGLAAPYRQNATWLMSSLTGAAIALLKDGQGNYIWREGMVAGQPPTLLGRPVEFDENMPAPEAGNLAIAFGDFKAGYLINDRIGTRVLRDPYTSKPFVTFYLTKRVGAGLQDPRAIRLMRIAAA